MVARHTGGICQYIGVSDGEEPLATLEAALLVLRTHRGTRDKLSAKTGPPSSLPSSALQSPGELVTCRIVSVSSCDSRNSRNTTVVVRPVVQLGDQLSQFDAVVVVVVNVVLVVRPRRGGDRSTPAPRQPHGSDDDHDEDAKQGNEHPVDETLD